MEDIKQTWDNVGKAGEFETRVIKRLTASNEPAAYELWDDTRDVRVYVGTEECVLAYLQGRIDGEGL